VDPVHAATGLLVGTTLLSVTALTTRAGGRIGRAAAVGMTGSVVVVASVMIAGFVGAEIPIAAAVLLTGCTAVVLTTLVLQARRLTHSIDAQRDQMRRIRRTAPWN
jgi:threonine/homoserine/homoserine lactone efflux protein